MKTAKRWSKLQRCSHTNKVIHFSKKSARRHAKKLPGGDPYVYRCGKCGTWHVAGGRQKKNQVSQ